MAGLDSEQLRAQQGGRNYGYAVLAAVGLRAGGDHDCAGEFVADLLSQPAEMPHIMIPYDLRQLRLDGDDAPVSGGHNEVDLVLAAPLSQMPDRCLREKAGSTAPIMAGYNSSCS